MEFFAKNTAGQININDKSITSTDLTELQNNLNAITFYNRYDITTYDVLHFYQLDTMFNLSLNYKF
mgnify:CR=1 FL=1